MGLNKLPLPIYSVVVFCVAVLLMYGFIDRLKKDRKLLLIIYLTFSISSSCIGFLTIFDKNNILLPAIISKVVKIFIALNLLIGFISLNYAGWTNKKDPNAKKKMAVASCFLLIALIGAVILVILIQKSPR
ncbi:MAG: hypothetical protein Q8942_08415 [Bacillota bacterium]|nr:hypothetical protein [Bacillota bacterium]